MGSKTEKHRENRNIFRLLRIARDRKVKDLADGLLVTPAYINAIEKGDRQPSERLVRDYAKAHDVDEQVIRTFAQKADGNTSFERLLLALLQTICSADEAEK